MIAVAALMAPFAFAVCDADLALTQVEEGVLVEATGEVGPGPAPCRSMVLGRANQVHIQRLKATIRHWDDSRTVLREDRLNLIDGAWVLSMPELDERDRFAVRAWGGAGPRWPLHTVEPRIIETRMTWEPQQRPKFGPGGNVALTVQRRLIVDDDGVTHVWFPPGTTEQHCTGSKTGVHLPLGCALMATSPNAQFDVGWVEPASSTSFEIQLDSSERLHLVGVTVASAGLEADASTDDGVLFTGPGVVSIRITALAGVPVADRALADVEHGSRAQSMPEPSVGLAYKGAEVSLDQVGDVLQLVRDQVVRGTLPSMHPLKPRSLMAVRASGWATPYESALLLTRYLEQLGFQAFAVPVRPSSAGVAVAGAPVGYTGAVVLAEKLGQTAWLDPSCAACAVGEVDPTLWGGAAFHRVVRSLPESPPEVFEQTFEEGNVVIRLSGPAAVRMRQAIMGMPRDASRARRIAELFGGSGATLVSIDGVRPLGSPMEIRVRPQSRR